MKIHLVESLGKIDHANFAIVLEYQEKEKRDKLDKCKIRIFENLFIQKFKYRRNHYILDILYN